jgi:Domain of unknown function (DUF4276)
MMPRLLVHVEGQTEETFVNEVLSQHLLGVRGYQSVSARLIGNARLRARRGGIRPWPSVKRDILRHLHEDGGCLATTMVDYYGLPAEGEGAWPGRGAAVAASATEKPRIVEEAMSAEIIAGMGGGFDSSRFMPFIVMHEFEGLLFSDCEAFARGIGNAKIRRDLQEIRDAFATPEEINDSPVTAPSKRVKNLIPEYQKPLFGNLAALEVGLGAIRNACPHFHEWLCKLEALAAIA